MDKADHKAFGMLLAGTAEAVGFSLSEAGVAVWVADMKPYPLAEITRAFAAHRRSSSFMPKPADIVRLIEGDPEAREVGAWVKLQGAVSAHGAYASVCFDDPAITAAVKSAWGDWPTFCQLSERELVFAEKRFREHYRAAVASRAKARYLPGLYERQNQGRFGPERIELIGDRERAAALLEGPASSALVPA